MSRPLRLEFPGALWHVTSRGNERREIVRDDVDRRRFVRFLAHVVRERRWLLHAWVLMSNHYHLLVETPEVGLSRGIQWLNQRYAETFNKRHARVGHLFQGRFKSILVERERHLLELLRYVVLNPVRCGLSTFAGEYAWSNYRATAGLQLPPRWLQIDWTLDQFGGRDRAEAREAYRRFVADGRGAAYNPREAVVGQIYLGGEGFRERMQAVVRARARSLEVPALQRMPARPSLEQIVPLITEVFEVEAEVLQHPSHQPARKALAMLAVEDAGLRQGSIAEWMGVSGWAVSKMRKAASLRYARDGDFRRRIDQVRAALG